MGLLCCKRGHVIDGMHLSGKVAAVFADGLKRKVDSGLGNVCYLN